MNTQVSFLNESSYIVNHFMYLCVQIKRFANEILQKRIRRMADIIKHSANQFSENFETLVTQIMSIGEALQQDARVVINRSITTKAWLTGYYIVEYEQHGNDRAKYGDNLLQNLSKRLGGKSYSATNLRSYRLFYMLYPKLRPVIANYLLERFGGETMESTPITFLPPKIQQSLIAELQDEGKQQSVTAKSARAQDSLIVTRISPDGFAMNILLHSQTPNYLLPVTSCSCLAKKRFENS